MNQPPVSTIETFRISGAFPLLTDMPENILMDDMTEMDSGHHNGKGKFFYFLGLFCQIRVQLFMTGRQLNQDTGIDQRISLL